MNITKNLIINSVPILFQLIGSVRSRISQGSCYREMQEIVSGFQKVRPRPDRTYGLRVMSSLLNRGVMFKNPAIMTRFVKFVVKFYKIDLNLKPMPKVFNMNLVCLCRRIKPDSIPKLDGIGHFRRLVQNLTALTYDFQ